MLPENIERLHHGEEALRVESLERIKSNPDLLAHLALIEQSMNLIHVLLPSNFIKNEDQLMIGNLGIRIFNSIASSLKLMMSGYYQASALQLRDVMETTFLLDYFSSNGDLICKWRTASEKERKNDFSPVRVRTMLDERDGFTMKKRAEAYNLMCKLAGHATPEGVVMLMPDRTKTEVHCGPFLENTALEAVISEAAKLALQATQAFRSIMANENEAQISARLTFMEVEAEWITHFYGGDKKADRFRNHPT